MELHLDLLITKSNQLYPNFFLTNELHLDFLINKTNLFCQDFFLKMKYHLDLKKSISNIIYQYQSNHEACINGTHGSP
ncbi:MAG: hypothetical protein EBY32_17745 [Proteobacteria bacterium]|nr:hypothetical protein [Pseudomonadota bacterium]